MGRRGRKGGAKVAAPPVPQQEDPPVDSVELLPDVLPSVESSNSANKHKGRAGNRRAKSPSPEKSEPAQMELDVAQESGEDVPAATSKQTKGSTGKGRKPKASSKKPAPASPDSKKQNGHASESGDASIDGGDVHREQDVQLKEESGANAPANTEQDSAVESKEIEMPKKKGRGRKPNAKGSPAKTEPSGAGSVVDVHREQDDQLMEEPGANASANTEQDSAEEGKGRKPNAKGSPAKTESSGAVSVADVHREQDDQLMEEPGANVSANTEQDSAQESKEIEIPKKKARGRKPKAKGSPAKSEPSAAGSVADDIEAGADAPMLQGEHDTPKEVFDAAQPEDVSKSVGRTEVDAPQEHEPSKRRRGRPAKPPTSNAASSSTNAHRGPRKRKASQSSLEARLAPVDYAPKCNGNAVLTCGDAAGSGQLAHGEDRQKSTKARRVEMDWPRDLGEPGHEIDDIAVGGIHMLVLSADGTVYAAGPNEGGTVPAEGLAERAVAHTLRKVPIASDVLKEGDRPVMVAAGGALSAVVTQSGDCIAWGSIRNSEDAYLKECPQFKSMSVRPTMLQPAVPLQTVCVKVTVGEAHIAVVTAAGDLLTFGAGDKGQLGRVAAGRAQRQARLAQHEPVRAYFGPGRLGPPVKFVDAWAFAWSTLARDNHDRIWAFGLNNYGQLGISLHDLDSPDKCAPEEVEQQHHVVSRPTLSSYTAEMGKFTMFVGYHHSIGLTEDGAVYACGRNTDNTLGLGTWQRKDGAETNWRYFRPQRVPLAAAAKCVAAANGVGAALLSDGSVVSWGCDVDGKLGLGLGDSELVDTPQRMKSKHLDDATVLKISMGDQSAGLLVRRAPPSDDSD